MNNIKIKIPIDQIKEFCEKWKIREFSFFGSILREDFCPDSDVDVLVSFYDDANWSLFDWVDMIDELQFVFKRKVDLVEKEAIRNPFRQHEILKTKEIVYAT